MLKSAVPIRLLAPAAAEGGTATADPMLESDPSGLSGWMKDLPPLTDTPPAENPTTKPPTDDGKTTDDTGGSGGAGMSPAAKPADAAPAAGAKPAAASPEPGKSNDAKPGDAKAKEGAVADEKAKGGEKAPEEKWPRSSADWDKYKRVHAEKETKLQKEIETRQERITALETQLYEVQKKTAETGELPADVKTKLDTLTKENQELSNRLQVLDVTQHPKFQAYFGRLVDNQKALAKNILGAERFPEFEKVLALPDGDHKLEKLGEFLENLPTLQQSRIGNVLNRLDEIAEEKRQEIEKAGQHKETITSQDKARRETISKQREAAINDFVGNLQKTNPAYQPKEGDEAWNKGIAERIAVAKRFLTGEGLKPAELIKAAFDAAQLPATLEGYKQDMAEKNAEIEKLTSEIASLKEQVSKFTAVQPKVNGGGPSAAGSAEPATGTGARPSVGMNPSEAMNAFTEGLWKANQ